MGSIRGALLASCLLAVAAGGPAAAADAPLANGTRGIVVRAPAGEDVRLVAVDGRAVPMAVVLEGLPLGEDLVLVQRTHDLPQTLSVGGREVAVTSAASPAVARISGADRRATALAAARAAALRAPLTAVVVADPGGLDRALLSASGPWPVLWDARDAIGLAPDVHDLAALPDDLADFAVAWDDLARGDAARDRVLLVADHATADLAAAAGLGQTVLITGRDTLPASTRAALERHAPAEILVIGGAAAISPGVEASLSGLAPTVRRVAGADRSATAAAVAALVPGGAVAVVNGANPVDAVAAAALDVPVLLTGPALRTAFAGPGCQRTGAVVVGGRAAVPDLVDLPSCRVTAFEVADRLTADLVAAWRDVAAEAGRPAQGPATTDLLDQAVARLDQPLILDVESQDGVASSIRFTVQRTRPDGSETAEVRWDTGDLTVEPERVDASSTVIVRGD